jgi:hypothetical protein
MRIFPASREKFAFAPEIEPIHRENNVSIKDLRIYLVLFGDGWQGKFFPANRLAGKWQGKSDHAPPLAPAAATDRALPPASLRRPGTIHTRQSGRHDGRVSILPR